MPDINSFNELKNELGALQKNQRKDYLIDRIDSFKEHVAREDYPSIALLAILKMLPQEAVKDFILDHVKIEFIRREFEFILCIVDLLKTLKKEDRLYFIIDKLGIQFLKEKINNSDCIVDLLETLKKEDRLDFIIDELDIEFLKEKMIGSDNHNFARLFSIIPNKHKHDFIEALGMEFINSEIIVSAIRFNEILQRCDESNRIMLIEVLGDGDIVNLKKFIDLNVVGTLLKSENLISLKTLLQIRKLIPNDPKDSFARDEDLRLRTLAAYIDILVEKIKIKRPLQSSPFNEDIGNAILDFNSLEVKNGFHKEFSQANNRKRPANPTQ